MPLWKTHFTLSLETSNHIYVGDKVSTTGDSVDAYELHGRNQT